MCTLPLPFWSSAPTLFLQTQKPKYNRRALIDFSWDTLLSLLSQWIPISQIFPASVSLLWVHFSRPPLFPLVPDTALFVRRGARSSGFLLSIPLWTWHCCWPLLSLLFEVLSLLSAFPPDRVNPPPLPTPSVGFNKWEGLTGTSAFVLSVLFHFS